MSTELIEVQKAVAEINRVEAGLAALREQYGGMIYPVATTKGMDAAKEARRAIREPRIEVEKIRKAAKAPILALSKRLDSEAARITAELEKIENPIHEQIKAEEKRKEDEKLAKIAAEVARVTAIKERIEELHGCMVLTPSSGANLIAEHISDLEALTVDESFQEFQDHAAGVKETALKRLNTLWSAARHHEAEQKRLEDERAELARQRAEQAERDRIAETERRRLAQEAAEAKARRDAEESEHAKQREKIRQEAAENDRIASERRADMDEEARRRAALNESAMGEIQAIYHQLVIADTGRAPYCKGGDVASIDWLIAETEKWPITVEKFGVLLASALQAKETVLDKLRQKREELVAREAAKVQETPIPTGIRTAMAADPADDAPTAVTESQEEHLLSLLGRARYYVHGYRAGSDEEEQDQDDLLDAIDQVIPREPVPVATSNGSHEDWEDDLPF